MNPRARIFLVAGICLMLGAIAGIVAARYGFISRHGDNKPEANTESHSEAKTTTEADNPPADQDETAEDEPQGAALVRTVAAVEGTIHQTLEAIGVASLPPTATSVISWPADAIITNILVQPGQAVNPSDPLAHIVITRDAQIQLDLATQTSRATSNALEAAQERLDRGLATKPEVLAAQIAADDATQRLTLLQSGLPPPNGLLRAPSAGIIAAVRTQPGATLTAGSPILELAPSSVVVAILGFEPAEARQLTIGRPIQIRPLDEMDSARYAGTVALIAPALNPTSRLIDVTVALSGGGGGGGPDLPTPGLSLRGTATLPDVRAVLIPRAALIPDGDDMIIFLARDGKAVRSPITIALRASDQVGVSSGCKPGDHVVIMGQGQLSDGAPVREQLAAPMTPTTPRKGAAGGD